MPPCVIVGERDGNGITACGGYSSGDFDAKPLLMMMFMAPLLLLLLLFVSFVFLLFFVVVVLCSCFPKKAIFFSLETNPEFKDPIPRLVVVERSFFEPNREILVVVSFASLSEVTIVRISRRRKTGDDDDDGVVDVVKKVGCVFDIIRIIIIVSIIDISRRPLLFVALKARKKDDGIGAILLNPPPLSSSASFPPLSLDPTKSVSLMMRVQKVEHFY